MLPPNKLGDVPPTFDYPPMHRVISGNLYDYPKYYDLVFGSDWKAEYDFLEDCFATHAKRRVRRLFEPACGTGRLLWRFAKAGYGVSGNDLNAKAVAYCNDRLARHGLPRTAVVGDMADFRLSRRVDAAFNTINSFRHLPSEAAAVGHLRSVASALAKGGLYILGLHLTPTRGVPIESEQWAARRGHLAVVSSMQTERRDRRRRRESVRMALDVYTPTRSFRLIDRFDFRMYTARQMADLIDRIDGMELVATHDFAYAIEHPIQVTAQTEDIVYILRKL